MELYKLIVGIIICIVMDGVIYSGQFESKLCLEQVLDIRELIKENKCPDSFLEPKQGIENCSILCKGRFEVLNTSSDKQQHCVDYTIHLNDIGRVAVQQCGFSKCVSKDLTFNCSIPISNQKENRTGEKGKDGCYGPGTITSWTVSSVLAGSLIGIAIFCLVKRYRNLKSRYDPQMPSSVFYQPSYPADPGLSEGRVIINPLEETEYADIEDQFKMVSIAIQVPSYKEDSSSSSRSRENIYHHLSGLEDRAKSALLSSDSLPEDYINGSKKMEIRSGSPSLKSFIIHAGSPSSKSNGESKVSPTGSRGSDKYFALEKEYLILKSDNGFA